METLKMMICCQAGGEEMRRRRGEQEEVKFRSYNLSSNVSKSSSRQKMRVAQSEEERDNNLFEREM
jgi:hypothetical protein